MNALYGIGLLAGIIYGVLVDATYFKIYFLLLLAYTLLTQIGTLTRYNSKRKKAAIATWNGPNSPEILASFDWDISKAQAFIQRKREESGLPISLTQFVGYAASRALSNCPNVNGKIMFGNYYPLKKLGISFLVAIGNGKDLGAHTIEEIDTKSLEEICKELSSSSKSIRSNTHTEHKQRTGALGLLPTFLVEPLMYIIGYLSSCVGLSLPMLGFKKHAFGACLITSVGSLGFEHVYAPFPPYANVPILLSIGASTRKPMAVGNSVQVRDVISISLTMDHRYGDGAAVAPTYEKLREYLNDPEEAIMRYEKPHLSDAPSSEKIEA